MRMNGKQKEGRIKLREIKAVGLKLFCANPTFRIARGLVEEGNASRDAADETNHQRINQRGHLTAA